MPPQTRYAKSGDVSIAYQVVGAGPRDLVLVPGWVSNLEVYWEEPVAARFFEGLAAFSRLILFDKRGTGLSDRVLATVMFADIVGSTERAAEVGDRKWRETLQGFHVAVRQELARLRGRKIDTAGDGVLAAFDGPARGVRCAAAIGRALEPLGLAVPAGLHTGECEILGDKLAGIAVHLGARVPSAARAGEALVSSTVRDLVAGSGLQFTDWGRHALRGIPGEWQLFAVERGNIPA